jgi:hypothetical protein
MPGVAAPPPLIIWLPGRGELLSVVLVGNCVGSYRVNSNAVPRSVMLFAAVP